MKSSRDRKEYQALWYQTNSERLKEVARLRRIKEDPVKKKQYFADYYLKNKDKRLVYQLNWQKENLEKHNIHNARYKASKRTSLPSWIKKEEQFLIDEIYALAKLRTKTTGTKWEVDHIIPLRGKLVSGLHVPLNLQVITKSSNCRKSNSYLPEGQ